MPTTTKLPEGFSFYTHPKSKVRFVCYVKGNTRHIIPNQGTRKNCGPNEPEDEIISDFMVWHRRENGLRLQFKLTGVTKYDFPCEDLKACVKTWEMLRDARGAGASDLDTRIIVKDKSGNFVAEISYNGRVWDKNHVEIIL